MKELHSEYGELAKKLSEIDAPNKRLEFEKEQRKRLEAFKKDLTVFATDEARTIDFEEIEMKIFADSNLESVSLTDEGYRLVYDLEGQPGFGCNYGHGGSFTPFAYDKVDAERYVKRQKRKNRIAAERESKKR